MIIFVPRVYHKSSSIVPVLQDKKLIWLDQLCITLTSRNENNVYLWFPFASQCFYTNISSCFNEKKKLKVWLAEIRRCSNCMSEWLEFNSGIQSDLFRVHFYVAAVKSQLMLFNLRNELIELNKFWYNGFLMKIQDEFNSGPKWAQYNLQVASRKLNKSPFVQMANFRFLNIYIYTPTLMAVKLYLKWFPLRWVFNKIKLCRQFCTHYYTHH